MKHQSYIRSLFVAFCAFFVCVSATAETTAEAATVHLNPFAFKVSSRLKGDVFNVVYYLNAPATSVKVTITLPNEQTVVYNCTDSLNTSRTSKVKGIYKLKISLREYINNIPDFRGKTDLPWSVDVMGGNQATYPAVGGGQKLEAKEVTSYWYNFYNPISVDIDVDPYSDNFGVIYMVERIDGVANAITNVDNISSYYGWHIATDDDPAQYKGGLYSFDPAFQNLPTMYSQVGAGKAYDYVNYDINKIKAARRDASMNANSSGHQGGAFNKNYLFGRVRIAYKDDHNHRVFMSFSPHKQTSGDKAIILGEVRTENYPLIGRVAGGGTSWFNQIIKANTYIQQITNGAGTVTTVGKVGYYNGNNFVAGPNIIFDASINNGYLSLLMVSGKYLDRDNTSREAYRCDEYKIAENASTISGPHKAQIFNLRKTENANDVNYWYSNGRKLVPSCSCGANKTCDYCVGANAVGFSNTYDLRGIEYDPDGKGFWHVQTRDNHNEIPSMVHFRYNEESTQYEVNFAEYICARGGGGVRYDITADRLAVSGGKFTTKTYTKAEKGKDAHRTKNVWPSGITDNFPKPTVENDWATIYTINKDSLKADMIDNYTDQSKKDYKETSVNNKKKVFTDSVLIHVGTRSNDFAWDYADNLYIASTSGHKFFAFALPHKDKVVSTPCKQNYYFDTPTQSVKIQITPNKSCGNVVDHDCPQMIQHWRNAEPNAFDYYYLADDADGDNTDVTKVKFQLEARPAAGYRFYTWDNVMQDKALNSVTTVQYVSTYAKTNNDEKGRTAHFGIDVWETKSITQTNEEMTFKGVFVQRELDDVSYSTICLPFNLTTLEGTPYQGASVLKFDKAEDSDVAGDNRTFLTFKEVTFTNGDIMEAGKPYLIKVNTPIAKGVEKIFKNVTCPPIGTQGQSVTKDSVTFHGLLNPTTFSKEQIKDKLFLTADNRLVSLYGQESFFINGLRGYFTVRGAAQNVEFVLNLPEKVTTSIPMVNLADSLKVTKYLWNGQIYIQRGNEVYDLSGVRVK